MIEQDSSSASSPGAIRQRAEIVAINRAVEPVKIPFQLQLQKNQLQGHYGVLGPGVSPLASSVTAAGTPPRFFSLFLFFRGLRLASVVSPFSAFVSGLGAWEISRAVCTQSGRLASCWPSAYLTASISRALRMKCASFPAEWRFAKGISNSPSSASSEYM